MKRICLSWSLPEWQFLFGCQTTVTWQSNLQIKTAWSIFYATSQLDNKTQLDGCGQAQELYDLDQTSAPPFLKERFLSWNYVIIISPGHVQHLPKNYINMTLTTHNFEIYPKKNPNWHPYNLSSFPATL